MAHRSGHVSYCTRLCVLRWRLRWMVLLCLTVAVLASMYIALYQENFGQFLRGTSQEEKDSRKIRGSTDLTGHSKNEKRRSVGQDRSDNKKSGQKQGNDETSIVIGQKTGNNHNSDDNPPKEDDGANMPAVGKVKPINLDEIFPAPTMGPIIRPEGEMIWPSRVTFETPPPPTEDNTAKKQTETPANSLASSSTSKEMKKPVDPVVSNTNKEDQSGQNRAVFVEQSADSSEDGMTGVQRSVIVYSCNKITICGGWADRQKGIVTAYVLSVLLDRDFKIDMPRPCDISRFLHPNEVDWVLKPNETDGHAVEEVEGIDSHGHQFVDRLLATPDMRIRQLDAQYVFLTSNMELVNKLRKHQLARQVPWLAPSIPLSEIYRFVLHKLFAPTPGLLMLLDDVVRSRPEGTKLVCAQVRMGKNGGFNDTESFNTMDGMVKLANFLSRYNDSQLFRIFFSSDSKQAVQFGKENFPDVALEVSGPITHVDKYEGDEACAGFGRAIADQLMLSTCDVLIISESGLGKIAAFLRNSDRELYLFHDFKVEKFRREMGFPNRYWW